MSRLKSARINGLIVTVVCGLALWVACSTDSPTAPLQVPPPPGDGGGSDAWTISVSASPSRVIAGGDQPTTVTVKVRDKITGANPPPGSTIALRTTLGEFDFSGSEAQSTAAVIELGNASALLFPGSVAGSATVTAEYDGSSGRGTVQVSSGEVFVSGLSPNSGTGNGGTRVTISGTGFFEPLRVRFGNSLAAVSSVSSDGTKITATTPPYSGTYNTTDCDSNGDGTLDGSRNVATSVDVEVELAGEGGSESLSDAFTYTPTDTKCYQTSSN
jgi:hypothetical protein